MARPKSKIPQEQAKGRRINEARLQECQRQMYLWLCVYGLSIKEITARFEKLFDTWASEGGFHHHATEKQWRTRIKKWVAVWEVTCKEGDHWNFDPPELAGLPVWDFVTPPGVRYEPSSIPRTTSPLKGSILNYDFTESLTPPTERGAQSSFSAPTIADTVSTQSSPAQQPPRLAYDHGELQPYQSDLSQSCFQNHHAARNKLTQNGLNNLALVGNSHLRNPYLQNFRGMFGNDGLPEA